MAKDHCGIVQVNPEDFEVSKVSEARDETLYAWTSAGDYRFYPQFINVSRKGGRIVVSVRSPEDTSGEHPRTGSQASVTLPDEEVAHLVEALSRRAAGDDVGRLREALEGLLAGCRTIALSHGIDIEAEARANPNSPYSLARAALTSTSTQTPSRPTKGMSGE